MATNRQINYQVNLSVNKTGLNELNQELDKIITKSREFSNVAEDSGYADPFQQAADAAMELKAILNSA